MQLHKPRHGFLKAHDRRHKPPNVVKIKEGRVQLTGYASPNIHERARTIITALYPRIEISTARTNTLSTKKLLPKYKRPTKITSALLFLLFPCSRRDRTENGSI
ncbi:unnamed protein product [Ascophyllum nodosum]